MNEQFRIGLLEKIGFCMFAGALAIIPSSNYIQGVYAFSGMAACLAAGPPARRAATALRRAWAREHTDEHASA